MRLICIVLFLVFEICIQINYSCCFGQTKRRESRKKGSLIIESFAVDKLESEFPNDTAKFSLYVYICLTDSNTIDRVYAFHGSDYVEYEIKNGEEPIDRIVRKEEFYFDGDNILYVEAGQWYYEVVMVPGLYAITLEQDKKRPEILRVYYFSRPFILE